MKKLSYYLILIIVLFYSCESKSNIQGYWFCSRDNVLISVLVDNSMLIVRVEDLNQYRGEEGSIKEYYFTKSKNDLWENNEYHQKIRLHLGNDKFTLTNNAEAFDFIKIDSIKYQKIIDSVYVGVEVEAAATVDTSYLPQ